jgi:Domain of unknown function (DUF1816)
MNAMTLITEPSISLDPILKLKNNLPLKSFIAHLTLNQKLSTTVLNLWTHALNAYCQAWWIEVFTAQPKCTYYFGPFAGAEEAYLASKGFIEDLECESAQGIEIKIDRHCQPEQLTIEHEMDELLQPIESSGENNYARY